MVKVARDHAFSPAGIGLVRWLGIAIGLAVVIRIPYFRRTLQLVSPSRLDGFWSFLIGLVFTGPAHLLYYLSIGHTSTTEGTVFNATSPLWVAFFAAVLLRESVDGRRWVALLLGAGGTYVTAVGFVVPSLQHGHAAWNGLYLLGTMLECIAGVLLAGLVRRSSGLVVLAWETGGIVLTMILGPVLLPGKLPLELAPFGVAWVPLAYLVLLPGLFAFGAWVTLVEKVPLSLMAVSNAIQPVFAAVIGFVAIGEAITGQTVLGTVLVILALVVAATDASGFRVNRPVVALTPSDEMSGE
jgi:drug/metabolite transporter (DMT)-like permease